MIESKEERSHNGEIEVHFASIYILNDNNNTYLCVIIKKTGEVATGQLVYIDYLKIFLYQKVKYLLILRGF